MQEKAAYMLMIFATGYFALATPVAMVLYPNYSIRGQFLSALGVGPTGVLFNPAVVLLGFATVFFYLRVYSKFQQWREVLPRSAVITGRLVTALAVVTGVLLIGIGLFISDGETSDIHDLLAISYFLLLIPVHTFLPGTLPLNLAPRGRLIRVVSYLTSVSTAVAFFVPGVNQYILQKEVVALQLVYFVLFSMWLMDETIEVENGAGIEVENGAGIKGERHWRN